MLRELTSKWQVLGKQACAIIKSIGVLTAGINGWPVLYGLTTISFHEKQEFFNSLNAFLMSTSVLFSTGAMLQMEASVEKFIGRINMVIKDLH